MKTNMDEDSESPNKKVEKTTRSKRLSEKKVKRKKTAADGTSEKSKVRKKSSKRDPKKKISDEDEPEDVYRSEANLIPGNCW